MRCGLGPSRARTTECGSPAECRSGSPGGTHFLKGAPKFEIWTDHQNLQYFREPQKLNLRQARWFTELAEYDFTLHHRPGRTNIIAAKPSRRGKPKGGVKDNVDIVLLHPDRFRQLAEEHNDELGVIIRALGFGDEDDMLDEIRRKHANRDDLVRKALAAGNKEFAELNDIVEYRGKVYVPKDRSLRERIVRAFHDTPIAGHPGHFKTQELVYRHYWWPGMAGYIRRYVEACDICQRIKPRNGPLAGPLHPNEPPPRPWEVVSADIIGPLPESFGFNAIFVVVDRHSKLVIICPTHVTVTSEGVSRLYRDYVFKRFGLFKKLISDRGPQFVSAFARDLYKLLGIEANPSTAYHPQTDGQTERENAEIEKYLRAWINARQDDWADWLSLAEFTINNRVSSATHESPFFVNHGRHPRMGFEPRRAVTNESAGQFAKRMEKTWQETQAALTKAAELMKTQYDRRRGPSRQHKVGDLVWLESTNLKLAVPAKKLAERRYGPFKILEKLGHASFKLELPEAWKNLHPVFHESLITKYVGPFARHQERAPPPPPTIVDDHEEYEIEEILDSRKFGRGVSYLVKWVGYGREHNSWIPRKHLGNAAGALEDFHKKHPGKLRHLFEDDPPSPRTVFPRSLFPPDFFARQHTEGIDFSLPDPATAARVALQREVTSSTAQA